MGLYYSGHYQPPKENPVVVLEVDRGHGLHVNIVDERTEAMCPRVV